MARADRAVFSSTSIARPICCGFSKRCAAGTASLRPTLATPPSTRWHSPISTLFRHGITSLRRFCHDLPAFLERIADYSDRPVIADLARIAEAMAEAFEAPDHAVSRASDLAIALTGTPTDFVVMSHPSVRRLTLLSNAAAIWLALESASPPLSELRCSEPQSVIVWRRHATATFRPLCPVEAAIWDAASAGTSVRTLCGMSAARDGSSVARYLSTWAAEGLLGDLVAR